MDFLTHIEIVDGKSETVKPPTKEFSKLEILATDLSIAIRDFILAQTFRVDKLTASTDVASTLIGETLIALAHTVGPPGPHTIPPIKIPPPISMRMQILTLMEALMY